LLALLVLVMPAAAGVSWCRADPIVELNGTSVQVWVAVGEEHEHLVSGPIQVTVYTPDRVRTRTTFLDSGFNGFGEVVQFRNRGWMDRYGRFDVDIEVEVPLNSWQVRREFGMRDVPILVQVITGDGQEISVEGRSSGTEISFELRGWR
jgi:hypothetical protein